MFNRFSVLVLYLELEIILRRLMFLKAFSLSFFKCGIQFSLESKITPKNLNCDTHSSIVWFINKEILGGWTLFFPVTN